MTALMLAFALLTAGPTVGITAKAEWDLPTTNADGSPCTDLRLTEIALVGATTDLRTTPTATVIARQSISSPETAMALGSMLSGRTPGPYRIQARCQDTGGNWSAWSLPADFSLDNGAPMPPANLRISVTIQITP